jgi:hypothetical protein
MCRRWHQDHQTLTSEQGRERSDRCIKVSARLFVVAWRRSQHRANVITIEHTDGNLLTAERLGNGLRQRGFS